MRRAGLLLLMSSCSAPAEVPNSTDPTTVVSMTAQVCPAGQCTPAPVVASQQSCIEQGTSASCDDTVGAEELSTLDASIAAAQKSVTDSMFMDVRAIVELGRLQLRRANRVSDLEGESDSARGLKNGMRAVAVDELAGDTRLLLALGLTHSFSTSPSLREPTTRRALLDLVQLPLAPLLTGTGAVAAAAHTLAGYIWLERGDAERATASFEAATRLSPGLSCAWIGLGDAQRAQSLFDKAVKSYQEGARLSPSDTAVATSRRLAEERQPLRIPAKVAAPEPLSLGDLAPAARGPALCTSAAAAGTPTLCKGLQEIAVANTKEALNAAALKTLDGYHDVKPQCSAKDPVCGAHVAPALLEAARAFQRAGLTAKSIAIRRILVARTPALPEDEPIVALALLELGDRYFSLGVFDQATGFYARYLEQAVADPTKLLVAERLMNIETALGDPKRVAAVAAKLARDTGYPAERRAAWQELAATIGRAAASPAARGPCSAAFGCAVRRLAGETLWVRAK